VATRQTADSRAVFSPRMGDIDPAGGSGQHDSEKPSMSWVLFLFEWNAY
jgi:hypothetical protein